MKHVEPSFAIRRVICNAGVWGVLAGTLSCASEGEPTVAATTSTSEVDASEATSLADGTSTTTTTQAPTTSEGSGGQDDAEGSGSSGGATDGDVDFDPAAVTSCADLGLEGVCVDVHNVEELMATQRTCPFREICRVVVHPGFYDLEGAVFTYHHWFRHYIGVLDERGERPVVSSQVGSVFANKGSTEVPLNIILQNLVLVGSVMGVDFDGATGDPYFSMGGLSWLDGVTIDTDSREVLFNTGPNPGGGSFWCTRCEIIHRQTELNPNSMIAISEIDSAWISDSTLRSDVWNSVIASITARSVNVMDVVDESGEPIGCGDSGIVCNEGPMPELLRAPTLEWFESLALAQPH